MLALASVHCLYVCAHVYVYQGDEEDTEMVPVL